MADRDRGDAFRSIWSDLQGVAFSQGYVEAAGVRTRYLHSGSADRPGLIFLHGTGGHAEAYVRNLAAHGAHFNTYAIDLLGHGYTGKPGYDYEIARYIDHLAGFMDAVGLQTASLSGESLGGWIAGAFAVARPERVDKLVLNTAGAEKVSPKALEALRESTLAAVEDPSWERVRARLEWLMRRPADVHDDLVASRQRIYRRAEMRAGIHHLLCLHTNRGAPQARGHGGAVGRGHGADPGAVDHPRSDRGGRCRRRARGPDPGLQIRRDGGMRPLAPVRGRGDLQPHPYRLRAGARLTAQLTCTGAYPRPVVSNPPIYNAVQGRHPQRSPEGGTRREACRWLPFRCLSSRKSTTTLSGEWRRICRQPTPAG